VDCGHYFARLEPGVAGESRSDFGADEFDAASGTQACRSALQAARLRASMLAGPLAGRRSRTARANSAAYAAARSGFSPVTFSNKVLVADSSAPQGAQALAIPYPNEMA
jgi:hypothetical protein